MRTKLIKRTNSRAILETWTPILKDFGIVEGGNTPYEKARSTERLEMIAEYAHNHAAWDNFGDGFGERLNEVATPGLFFQQPGSISAMGHAVAPTPTQTPFGGTGSMTKGTSSDSGSGDKFPSLLPIAIQVAARTIGFDLVSVIPMDTPVGFIPYLDYVYLGGNLDTEFPPFLIKLGGFDPDSPSDDTPTTTTFADIVPGDHFVVYVTAGTTECIDLRFVGFSRVDASPIFRVIDLTSATVEAAFTIGYILTATSGDYVGSEWTLDANNHHVDLVSALENQISGFTSTNDSESDFGDWQGPFLPAINATTGSMSYPGSMKREQAEKAKFRQMGVKMFTKFVEAEGDQVALSATVEQIQDFNRVWNFDVISMLENTGVNDIAQNINKRIVSRQMELGWLHNKAIAKAEGSGLTTLSLDAGGGFENTSTLQRRVATKILEMANLIYHRSRWGGGEFVVTNGRVASAIADIAGYSIATAPINTPSAAGQLTPAGTVWGLQIYVDPNLRWGDNRVLIGRKGKDEEPGLKFLPYIMAESLQTISEGTFSPKIGIKSRYAMTEAGWHPETQYILLEVDGIAKIVAGQAAVALPT